MKIYQIDTSARKEGSTSRALAKKLLDKIKKLSLVLLSKNKKQFYQVQTFIY